MLIVAISVLVGLLAIGASVREFGQLRRAPGRELERLGTLPRAADHNALARVAGRLPASSPLREAIEGVLDAPSRAGAVAASRELTLDAEAETREPGRVASTAARVSLATGTLCALVGFAEGLGAEGERDFSMPLVAFAVGMTAAGVAAAIGRRAGLLGRQRRERYAELLAALERCVPASDPDQTQEKGEGISTPTR